MAKKKAKEQARPALQWALPDGAEIPPDDLQARIDIFNESCLFHFYNKAEVETRLVSPIEVAMVFTKHLPVSSDLLPEGALWWTTGPRGAEVGLYVEGRVRVLALQLEPFKPPARYKVPVPNLVFACVPGQPPRVAAVKRYPRSEADMVYHAPFYNVFLDGRVCAGSHKFSPAIHRIPEDFFVSLFSPTGDNNNRSKQHPRSLQGLWESLRGKDKYPVEDLVQWESLEKFMKGETK